MTKVYLGKCEAPDLNLLPPRDARRKFRTGKYVETVIEFVDRIDVGGKTEKNRARSEGTDTDHATALYNELCSGIRYDQLPPIVVKIGTSYCLIDGFTRLKALKKKGQERWCFDVYEINDGFTLSELKDEIGLGANNHVVAKRATRADFIVSGMQWVKLNDKEGKTISKKDIKNWLDSIPNSWTTAQKTDIINKIFDKAYPDCSVATFTESEASQYLEPLGYASKGKDDGDGFVGRTFAATINATHAPRNFCHALNDFFQHGKRTRINLFAPNGTKSKDVERVIQSQKEEIEKWEKALDKYYGVKQTLIAQGQDFRLIEFGVRPSQLVDVDPDGGVVPLD
tara:strand:+ start:558 stop:1577 length:1020 start_codon:yes stop_codon:yes gene_type:complete